MTPDELKEKARRFIDEIFNRRNVTYAEENLSEDFVEHSPYPPATGSDKRAALDGFQAILDSSEDVHADVLELVSDGRRVAIRARYSGTDTGGFLPGMPPTNKRYEIEGIDVATVDDSGNFSEHYGIPDVGTAMQQLGLLPSGAQTS